ncbi:MAG: glycosyl transferase [Bacteroidetes bacterium]|nr:MAG: glycosyl transferase [Bacteroidota bacterium]
MQVLLYILAFIYFLLILLFFIGWIKNKTFVIDKNQNNNKIHCSIIIATRNEEKNILSVIDNITKQTYRNFELIIVDDNSTDSTVKIAETRVEKNPQIKLLKLSNNESGKKSALKKGIEDAKGKLVITTDADCSMNKKWLATIVSFYEQHLPKMIISPVIIDDEKNIFEKLQSLEFLSLIGSGAGAININHAIMCNGANLAFEKNIYLEFNNALNNKFASGDDVFLMLKTKKKYSKKIRFLKSQDATVYTKASPDLKTFINQRKRWTSKSRAYYDFDIIFTAIVVFLTNFSLLFTLIASIFNFQYFYYFIIIFTVKSIIDFFFLLNISYFFNKIKLMIFFIPLQVLYFFYISFVSIMGNISKFEWKERKLKK